jgi:PHP family Zn ribbon phosphoesterase
MKTYRADLHVHTVLSPCAEIEMIPPLIVDEAVERGIDLIAITDHNASENVIAVMEAARGTPLIVLPGIEVQTIEEVHVICLFDTLEQVMEIQTVIDQSLPDMLNRPEYFGDQLVVTSEGDYIRSDPRLRLTSVNITLKELFQLVRNHEGLPIPAHVDRKANGLIEVLGLIPQDIKIDGLEVTRHFSFENPPQKYKQVLNYPLIQNGDVHRLEDFLGRNVFTITAPTVSELKQALKKENNRFYQINNG